MEGAGRRGISCRADGRVHERRRALGCGIGYQRGASTAPVVEQSAVPFTDCGEACEGEIDGAKYRILLPDEWNGTLLLYSHGYRNPVPVPPDYESPTLPRRALAGLQRRWCPAGPQPAEQGLCAGRLGLGQQRLGRRRTGSRRTPTCTSSSATRWASRSACTPGATASVGWSRWRPSEANPDWVSGAAPLVRGRRRNRAEHGPGPRRPVRHAGADRSVLPADGVRVGECRRVAVHLGCSARCCDEAASTKDRANVLALALLADARLQTQSQDGSTIDSQIQAAAEAALIALRFGTVAPVGDRATLRGQHLGQHRHRLRRAGSRRRTVALLDEVGGPGTAKRIIAALDEGERVCVRSGGGEGPPARVAVSPPARSRFPPSPCTPPPIRWSRCRTRPCCVTHRARPTTSSSSSPWHLTPTRASPGRPMVPGTASSPRTPGSA